MIAAASLLIRIRISLLVHHPTLLRFQLQNIRAHLDRQMHELTSGRRHRRVV